MVLKSFFLQVLIRTTLIVVSGVALGMVIQHLDQGYYYTLTGLIFLIIIQTWLLILLVNKTNNDLDKFLSSIQDLDSSVRFSEYMKNASFQKLHNTLNRLLSTLQKGKIENERSSHFLQSLVSHLDVGLLSFNEEGRIEICNKTAKKYVGLKESERLTTLKNRNEELYQIITNIKPGQEILYKTKMENPAQSILVKAIEIRFENRIIKLVSFYNITSELDKKESDSWQRLIRVLTHEIMNSISPVTSLTSVISGYYTDMLTGEQISPEKMDQTLIRKTLTGLNTIEETSKGLLHFVDQYRSLSSIPKPEFAKVSVDHLFSECKTLMEPEIPAKITIHLKIDPQDITLFADYRQIQQVLINLVKNAADALSSKPEGIILLKAFHYEDHVILEVEDNGKGIPEDILADIFVPFYTTKENGSGIGLSLSKQIMHNHHGTITVRSVPGEGSTFTLQFD